MATTFMLGLAACPHELFQGLDKNGATVCDILHRELDFPRLVPTTPGSSVWTAAKPGVTASVMYVDGILASGFERLTGIAGRLHVGLRLDKKSPWRASLQTAFSTAHGILARTDWDAAFCFEWDHVILRRIDGQTHVEDLSPLFSGGDTEALLRELDPSGQAHRGHK